MVKARTLNRLSPTFVAKHLVPGLYGDGNGLYLQITAGKDDYVTKSWIFRYAAFSRERNKTVERKMGLGPYPLVSLAMAREMAIECSLKRLRGIDPLDEREAAKRAKAIAAVKTITFEKAADLYIAAHQAGWKNVKHGSQWRNTLKTYAYPVFGTLAVRDIDTGLVMRVLEPIWTTKSETASRVRGRIESILDWSRVNGYREGENPARWSGHLDHLLPEHGKVHKIEHHPALPHAQVPAFMAELRNRTSVSAKCLEFTILTVARTSEAIGATWDEIDTEKVWTVPRERMKGDREHRVPLSAAAVAVIEHLKSLRHSDYVFPGGRQGKPLSNMAMLQLLEQMNAEREKTGLPRWNCPKENNEDATPHGFRSSFRDWVSEETNFPGELAEAAMAHIKGDKVEAAYKRGTMFEKRRTLMDAWAAYCAQPAYDAKVVPLRSGTDGAA
jgi:integrase